jgi:ParB-like chromosome segregation protein Spo0J
MAALRHNGLRPDYRCKKNTISIVYRNIDELKLDPRNPRRHSRKQVGQLARSIEAFGFNVPCIVDEHLQVINGHGRLAAARLLDMEQVPTICITHLSGPELRAFQIADNRLNENSTWNRATLAQELQILKTANLDFDLSSTGFEIEEINLLTVGLEPSSVIQPKELPEELRNTESEIAASRPGDVWVLGKHRLICGNPSDEKTYLLLMNGRRAVAVLTHVPAGAGDDAESLLNLFSGLAKHSDPAALQFVVADQFFMKSLAVAEGAGLRLLDVCVAVKTHVEVAPGHLYQKQHELVFVFENGKAEPLGEPQVNRSNVWFYPHARRRRAYEERKAQRLQNYLPVALVADMITDSIAYGGIVLDPFIGTGTTLMAAEQTGRVCYAIESDALQLDRSMRSWQELTGKNAMHQERRMFFDQIGEERHGRD